MTQKVDQAKLTSIIENGTRIDGRIMMRASQGYGFISCHEIPFTRIFFHWSGLDPKTKHFTELKVGDHVTFELIEHDKGLQAVKILVKVSPDELQRSI